MEESGSQSCPRCGKAVDTLIPIETGMRLALQTTNQGGEIPESACTSCFAELSAGVSRGFKLRTEREARDKNRMLMWKNRISLVKQARALMINKSYSEAAVAYEKYIRVLEVVNNLERGELSPAVFSNSTHSKEMTIIASAYWDLLRIYDTNPAYGERMDKASEQLALFLPFSPLYPNVVRKAEQFLRTAKNPRAVRSFLRACKTGRGPCFIATAVFEDEPLAYELFIFRRFRDEVLKKTPAGRRFVLFYYRRSPTVANWLRQSRFRKEFVKILLRKLAAVLKKSLNSV
jgi:hypothetical protein